MLTEELCSLLDQGWKSVFAQKRSRERAIEHALALPCIMGRRTISRTICALGRSDKDWSADYKIFSRSQWKAESLFDPVIENYLARYPDGPIRVACDDTRLKKSGKKIANAFWQRYLCRPPFISTSFMVSALCSFRCCFHIIRRAISLRVGFQSPFKKLQPLRSQESVPAMKNGLPISRLASGRTCRLRRSTPSPTCVSG